MAIRILLIDDNPDQVAITKRALGDSDQYDVDAALTAAQGLEKLFAHHYDVVLCDYRLPELTGLEILRQINASHHEVPFVIVTAAGNERVAVEAMREGASDYLVKDAAYDTFLPEVIHRSLERHREKAKRQRAEAEQRQAEAALQQMQHELIQAEKMSAVGQLASGIAHEVKNPLAILQQGLHHLERHLGPDEQLAETIEMMKESVARADTIIRGLLNFSRPAPLMLLPNSLIAVIEDALVLVQKQLAMKDVVVERALMSDLPLVQLDKNQMEQVFVNLVLNAFQAMPCGGRLRVRAYVKTLVEVGGGVGQRSTDRFRAGERVVVCEVEDTGLGIPASRQEKVFDPFYTTKPPGEGTGLGLTIVRTIVEAHGGLITLRSAEGRGTTVSIVLPICDPAHERRVVDVRPGACAQAGTGGSSWTRSAS